MKCIMCKHGETKPGFTQALLARDNFTLVIRGIPAEISGEDYIGGNVGKKLYHPAEQMKDQGTVLDVRTFSPNPEIRFCVEG